MDYAHFSEKLGGGGLQPPASDASECLVQQLNLPMFWLADALVILRAKGKRGAKMLVL